MSTSNDKAGISARAKARRPLWKRFTLAAGGLMLAPLLLEAALRLWYAHPLSSIGFLDPSRSFSRYYVMPDAAAGYALRPYFHGEMKDAWGDFDAEFDVNQYGYRDRHDPGSRPAGKILAAGDSFTFGHGVSAEETYPAQLESKLGELHFPATECINAGVPGYGIKQDLVTLERALPLYDPSLVMVGWVPRMYAREFAPLNAYYEGYLIIPGSEKNMYTIGGYPFYTTFSRPLWRRLDVLGQAHSLLYLFVRFKVQGYLRGLAFDRKHPMLEPLRASELELAVSRLEQARDRSLSGGANFLLLAFCYDDAESRLVRDLCAAKGIAVFPMAIESWTEKNRAEPSKLFFRHDLHPTAFSYGVLATELAVFLRNHPQLVLSRPPEHPEQNDSSPAPTP